MRQKTDRRFTAVGKKARRRAARNGGVAVKKTKTKWKDSQGRVV